MNIDQFALLSLVLYGLGCFITHLLIEAIVKINKLSSSKSDPTAKSLAVVLWPLLALWVLASSPKKAMS